MTATTCPTWCVSQHDDTTGHAGRIYGLDTMEGHYRINLSRDPDDPEALVEVWDPHGRANLITTDQALDLASTIRTVVEEYHHGVQLAVVASGEVDQ